jgi:amino-acid N-acetyltransferase
MNQHTTESAPESQPTIEMARQDDLPAVLSLLETCRLPREGVEAHADTLLVARVADAIVGSAELEMYGDAALLRSVAVAEAWRGSGLGKRLTRVALDLARSRGVRTVFLLTETAGSFFPRFGFQTVARADVPGTVQQSLEFQSLCPASAIAMMCHVNP